MYSICSASGIVDRPAPHLATDICMNDRPTAAPSENSPLARLFASDHQSIGLNYLWLALFSVFLGLALSLLMRIHLVWPGAHLPLLAQLPATPDRYSALATLHGSLMVFFVLTAAPQAGFGSYFLPLQIGARELAFPSFSLISFWLTALSLVGMTSAFFVPVEAGLTLWLFCVALFCLASVLTAFNFGVTTIELRAPGMTLSRLPLTAWAWLVTAILGSLIFSVLFAACSFLLSDRLLGTHFFAQLPILTSRSAIAAGQGIPLVWNRLFWFFAQAEVYVAMLPCFGITSHLVSIFSRKPVWAERAVVLALCAVGLFGFSVWGYHMFATGLNPYAPLVFATLAESLALPAIFLLASWFGTLWHGKIRLATSMLFAIGFISLFLCGGLSGLFLARQDLASAAVSDDFITAHFHLVMGVAATFSIIGALFFWFPSLFGRRLNETLGKIHFWMTFVGVYCIFMPMHWLGLFTRSPASASAAAVDAAISNVRAFVTVATVLTVAAQLIFLFNFFWSLRRGELVIDPNPWRANTLEWCVAPEPPEQLPAAPLMVYRGAYDFSLPDVAQDFVPQHLAPDRIVRIR